jgi:hypothetical protein
MEALSDLEVETMRVAPLAPEKANALFASLAGLGESGGTTVEAAQANQVAGGNPLYLLELARHVRETGQVSSLPQSLRALIRDRAARLSPAAQHVLHTCAVLGRYSSVSRVSSVLEIGTADLLACIEELDALGIVGAARNAEVLSIHDLWRDELLKQLLPASRNLLHHRCGLVLEGECRVSRAPSIVWEAAQHFLASGAEGRALSLLEESAQHQLDNGLPIDAAESFDLAFRASTTDGDRLRALQGRIAALRKAADWKKISPVVDLAIEIATRSSIAESRHTELELLKSEVMWKTGSELELSFTRSFSCALDAAAPTSHRGQAAVQAVIGADNLCRFDAVRQLDAIARELEPTARDARALFLSVRLVFETVLGSLEKAVEFGTQVVAIEREAGSVRGLARALCWYCHAARMTPDYLGGIRSAQEALELAERHGLVGEAATAIDMIVTVHVEREDLDAARAWIARSEALASRVGAPFALASLAVNRAIVALMSRDHERAMTYIQPFATNLLGDPLIRQRMLYLSILARIYVARADHENLALIIPSLRDALALRRSTGAHDFHVASYAQALEVLEGERSAKNYVARFVTGERRDLTRPSAEIRHFL